MRHEEERRKTSAMAAGVHTVLEWAQGIRKAPGGKQGLDRE